jgi:hypothetical protein
MSINSYKKELTMIMDLSSLSYTDGYKIYQDIPLIFIQDQKTDTEFSVWENEEYKIFTFRATEEGKNEWFKKGVFKKLA